MFGYNKSIRNYLKLHGNIYDNQYNTINNSLDNQWTAMATSWNINEQLMNKFNHQSTINQKHWQIFKRQC